MSAVDTNVVVITGHLTRDPELRETPSGATVCTLRVASNSRTKDSQTGKFGTKPNYFNVAVWGHQAENCHRYLAKGRPVAIQGRLDWHERAWSAEAPLRESVQIVATTVQFLGSRSGDENGGVEEEGDESPSSDGGACSSFTDYQLMRMKRSKVDELAVQVGVENPEQYVEKKDLVDALREKEAENARADEVEGGAGDE